MQCRKFISRVKFLGIYPLAFACVLLVFASWLAALNERTSSNIRGTGGLSLLLEDWWKLGQGFFCQHVPPPDTAESLALNSLIAWRAGGAAWSDAEIRDLSHFILSRSSTYRISPVMVLSLIEVESGFQRSAVSTRGAVGLMQLLPSTAMEVAMGSGMHWRPQLLEDPKVNIELGLRYVTTLKQEFGVPEHFLTAYNIGPYALKRKLRDGEVLPRAYYNRVMGTLRSYQNKARGDRVAPKLWAKTWL